VDQKRSNRGAVPLGGRAPPSRIFAGYLLPIDIPLNFLPHPRNFHPRPGAAIQNTPLFVTHILRSNCQPPPRYLLPWRLRGDVPSMSARGFTNSETANMVLVVAATHNTSLLLEPLLLLPTTI